MSASLDWDRIDRYFAGELGEDDAAQLRRWLMAHPVEARVLESVGVALDGPGGVGDIREPDALASWRVVAARRRAALAERPAVMTRSGASRVPRVSGMAEALPHTRRSLRRVVWTATSAFALGVMVTALGWMTVVHRGGRATSGSVLTYTTARGQRATITLPDGGTVALNADSRLDVPLDYKNGDRQVRLTGEGLFTVPHHNGAPFTVTAGATTARVLGTSFVVRRYVTDTATTVAVRDGKVAVGRTVVTANRLVTVGTDGVPHPGAADSSQFSFVRGVLTLEGVPFPAAITELDRWYDADIRLGDSTLASRHVKGSFAAGSLGDLAAILGWTYDVRVVRNGRVLTLYPRR